MANNERLYWSGVVTVLWNIDGISVCTSAHVFNVSKSSHHFWKVYLFDFV